MLSATLMSCFLCWCSSAAMSAKSLTDLPSRSSLAMIRPSRLELGAMSLVEELIKHRTLSDRGLGFSLNRNEFVFVSFAVAANGLFLGLEGEALSLPGGGDADVADELH
jgi:hypothetical protein